MEVDKSADFQAKARELGVVFARSRAKNYLERFLKDAELDAVIADHLEATDVHEPMGSVYADDFGRYVALIYAIGYLDGVGKTEKNRIIV